MGATFQGRQPPARGVCTGRVWFPVPARLFARTLNPALSAPRVTMIATPCCTHSAAPGLYTLEPLVALGADALVPDPALGIKGVFLQELGIGWDNLYQQVMVWRASDVFACAAAGGWWCDLLPPGARVMFAVLRFHLTGAGQPCLAEIWPPHILTLSPAHAADPMKGWLAAHGFIHPA
jgi:hypothetical protein